MRIAVSGTHFSGKTTLISTLLKSLPEYTSIEEPYYLLVEEGYLFSDPPTLEDYEKQLLRSITAIDHSQNNTIFDRCPLDFLAYMSATSRRFVVEDWISEIKGTMQKMDLLVFLPIEHKDRIPLPSPDYRNLRLRVDEKLHDMLIDNSLSIVGKVLEVTGTLQERAQSVLEKLNP